MSGEGARSTESAGMTINLGAMGGIATHYGEASTAHLPSALCVNGGGRFQARWLNLFTTESAKVDCPGCLEWVHA